MAPPKSMFTLPIVITKSKDNMIHALGGKPALQALRDAIMDMPVADRRLLENGLHQAHRFEGHFLLRRA